MVFSSLPFLFVFLVVTLILYYCAPRRLRNGVLFVMSLFFYGYGEPVYVLLMLFSVLLNYVSGLLIGKYRDVDKKKKAVLIANITVNLLLLGFFKYTGLLTDTLREIPALSFLPKPEIALPIGISFYTFQTMSYVIDTYRGNCEPQKSFVTFGTYVALFPQLIAGPIVRYVDVERQLSQRHESPEMFTEGIKLFILGLAKKVLLANSLGLFWSEIKASENVSVLTAWAGIIGFTMQIYFDFSGYSDMARGLGNMFGFSFIKNFDYPYLSRSITEFWRRWHISLGIWFREYVYIPLGGNRRGKLRQCLNIFIVWGLTGIWHGASWNFLIWGLYFGLLLTVEKFFLLKLLKRLPVFVSRIYALFFVIIGWVIFDFSTVGEIAAYISSMFTGGFAISGNEIYILMSNLPLLLISAVCCTPVLRALYKKAERSRLGTALSFAASGLVLVLSTASLVSSTYNPFLYFRF